MSTLGKKIKNKSAQHGNQLIQAKVRNASVPSLILLLWTSRSTCRSLTALAEDRVDVTVVELRTQLGL